MKITVVIPVFNEKDSLGPLVEGILEYTSQFGTCRILFIDDGSTDGSADVMDSLHKRHLEVDVLRFARNRGKSDALAAGFAHADGDVVVMMDADLQDDPKEIPRLIATLNKGFDLVAGWKQVRHDPLNKTFPSKLYNAAVDRLFGLGLHDINCGFKAMKTEVAKSLQLMGDMHRLIPAMAAHNGYSVTEVAVEHHPRRHGQSKYGCERFERGAADLITLYFLTRHRQAPNHFFGAWGLRSAALGAIMFLYALIAWSGSALAVAAILFLGGATLTGLGLLGELILRLHLEKNPIEYKAEVFFH